MVSRAVRSCGVQIPPTGPSCRGPSYRGQRCYFGRVGRSSDIRSVNVHASHHTTAPPVLQNKTQVTTLPHFELRLGSINRRYLYISHIPLVLPHLYLIYHNLLIMAFETTGHLG
jgi:hypothetical protein